MATFFCDGVVAKIYLDGVLDGYDTFNGTTYAAVGIDVYLGYSASFDYYTGKMDEAWIYYYAMDSDKEIKNLYLNGMHRQR